MKKKMREKNKGVISQVEVTYYPALA